MSLDRLAKEIIDLAQSGRSTPVLVTPPYLSFRPEFFQRFAAAIASRTDRPVRIDWLRTGEGVWAMVGDRLAARQAAKITKLLRKSSSLGHSISVSEAIGRPSAASNVWVIGLSNSQQPLPPWATPIPLGEQPSPS